MDNEFEALLKLMLVKKMADSVADTAEADEPDDNYAETMETVGRVADFLMGVMNRYLKAGFTRDEAFALTLKGVPGNTL